MKLLDIFKILDRHTFNGGGGGDALINRDGKAVRDGLCVWQRAQAARLVSTSWNRDGIYVNKHFLITIRVRISS